MFMSHIKLLFIIFWVYVIGVKILKFLNNFNIFTRKMSAKQNKLKNYMQYFYCDKTVLVLEYLRPFKEKTYDEVFYFQNLKKKPACGF